MATDFFELPLNPQQADGSWKRQEIENRFLDLLVLHIFCDVDHVFRTEWKVGKSLGSGMCGLGFIHSDPRCMSGRGISAVVTCVLLVEMLESHQQLLHGLACVDLSLLSHRQWPRTLVGAGLRTYNRLHAAKCVCMGTLAGSPAI